MVKTNQIVSQGTLFPKCEVEQVKKTAQAKITVKQLQEEKSKLEEQIKELETENAKLKIMAVFLCDLFVKTIC